jgi:nucleoside-diphosphate-sugar epimerase
MKKAIVTGANGFLGCALCNELSNQGIEVIAVVRNKNVDISKIQHIDNLKVVYCDLSNFKHLADVITERDADVLFHLAWAGSAGPLRGDIDVQLKNIQYTCDTVKACADLNCKKFVFAASIMEYEIETLMTSDDAPGINTLYCSAKVAADYMTRTLAGALGISYIRAVISNIYGPGEVSPRLINTSLRKLLSGEHCAFSPGEQIYDFIYITDAAKAFVALGRNGIANRTYYIGSQSPKPLKEFLCEMRDQVNPSLEIGLGEIPFNGISLTYKEFDIFAVKNDTGFIPEVSFDEGITSTINWIKELSC